MKGHAQERDRLAVERNALELSVTAKEQRIAELERDNSRLLECSKALQQSRDKAIAENTRQAEALTDARAWLEQSRRIVEAFAQNAVTYGHKRLVADLEVRTFLDESDKVLRRTLAPASDNHALCNPAKTAKSVPR